MTPDGTPEAPRSPVRPLAGDDAGIIREQARRYLVAVYGPEWLYRAPESFEGSHRWIWAVANDQAAMAETAMARVEQVCAERRAGSSRG